MASVPYARQCVSKPYHLRTYSLPFPCVQFAEFGEKMRAMLGGTKQDADEAERELQAFFSGSSASDAKAK